MVNELKQEGTRNLIEWEPEKDATSHQFEIVKVLELHTDIFQDPTWLPQAENMTMLPT